MGPWFMSCILLIIFFRRLFMFPFPVAGRHLSEGWQKVGNMEDPHTCHLAADRSKLRDGTGLAQNYGGIKLSKCQMGLQHVRIGRLNTWLFASHLPNVLSYLDSSRCQRPLVWQGMFLSGLPHEPVMQSSSRRTAFNVCSKKVGSSVIFSTMLLWVLVC